MGFTKSESGNVLVVTALCSSILMAFAGMALDVGLAYRTRQKVQTAADAGAIAAALSYLNYGSGATAADAAVLQNGYPSGDVAVSSVTFNGQSGFSQVTVTTRNPTSFMRVFGFNSLTVAATAVAGPALVGSACNFLTGTVNGSQNVKDAFYLKGAGAIQTNCGIDVDDNNSEAVDIKDCGSINGGGLAFKFLDVVGGAKLPNGNCTSGLSPITTGAPAAYPLGATTWPARLRRAATASAARATASQDRHSPSERVPCRARQADMSASPTRAASRSAAPEHFPARAASSYTSSKAG